MSKTYFHHISEAIKARDLIFSIDTPWGLENKMPSEVPIWTPGGATSWGGATYMSKPYFHHISEAIKARDLIFGTDTPYDLENTML